MSSKALCCDVCFGLIARKSTGAARLWLDLCEIQTASEIFGLLIDDNPRLRLLERLNLLTTTETREMIIVKIHGRTDELMGPFFCGGFCHGED